MAPVPVTAVPAHLLGLQMFRLFAGGDSGTSVLIARRQPSVFCERMRRKRRGLRARGQRDRTRAKSKGKFQKVAAFHDISLFVSGE
jgi:hypothetical protein